MNNHFVVLYTKRTAVLRLRSFGEDAQRAFGFAHGAEAMASALGDHTVEVCHLMADSVEAIRRTHSRYFSGEAAEVQG